MLDVSSNDFLQRNNFDNFDLFLFKCLSGEISFSNFVILNILASFSLNASLVKFRFQTLCTFCWIASHIFFYTNRFCWWNKLKFVVDGWKRYKRVHRYTYKRTKRHDELTYAKGFSQNWCSLSPDGLVMSSIGILTKCMYSVVHYLSNKHPQMLVCQIHLELQLVLWKLVVLIYRYHIDFIDLRWPSIFFLFSRLFTLFTLSTFLMWYISISTFFILIYQYFIRYQYYRYLWYFFQSLVERCWPLDSNNTNCILYTMCRACPMFFQLVLKHTTRICPI